MTDKNNKFYSKYLLEISSLFPGLVQRYHIGDNSLALFFSFVLAIFMDFEPYHLFGSKEGKTVKMIYLDGILKPSE